jgi:hypothetical protein
VGSTNYTTTLTNLTKGPYKIYIVGILSGNKSLPSNIVVYNNEIVTKKSVNADNKTYSVDVTDLGNTITDIANGNIDTVNETSNGGSIFNSEIDYYIIENTNNNTNAVFLPDYLITENNKTITIVNKTLDSLTILSTAPIYNIQYTPTEGTHALEIGENAIVILRYIYTKDHTLSIYADML